MYVWMRLLHHFRARLRHHAPPPAAARPRCPNCGEAIFAAPGEAPRCPRCTGEVVRREEP